MNLDYSGFTTRHLRNALIGAVIIVALLFLWPFVIVPAGHRGVVLNFGEVQEKILGEGLHWRTPILQTVEKIEVRTVKTETEAIAYSKDIQTVSTALALNYHVDANAVNLLYRDIGPTFESKVIEPQIQEAVKSIIAKYTAQELVEKRELVKEEIRSSLDERLTMRYIVVEDLSITNFDFSDEFEAAVEAKQKAAQDALKAQNDLARIEFEAQQRIETATAEAEAIRIQAQAVTQQGGRDYVSLKWVEKWDGKLPTTSMGGEVVPMIQIGR